VTLPSLHQFMPSAAPGDALSDQAFLLRRWLRELGFTSDLFAEYIAPELQAKVYPLSAYRRARAETLAVYHHGLGSRVVDFLLTTPLRLILIYQNVTPPEFYRRWHATFVRDLDWGLKQLHALRERTVLALGASAYTEAELRAYGFEVTGILPVTLDESQYTVETRSLSSLPHASLHTNSVSPNTVSAATPEAQLSALGPRLLSLGRLVPNKRIEDLFKLLYCYRQVEPEARLWLVGRVPHWLPAYRAWLDEILTSLKLRDAVELGGYVSQTALLQRFRQADVYLSMSEHEGFGKPLAESMYLGLPVLAYAAAAVPDTLGRAGILFRAKHFEALVEVIQILRADPAWRQRLIARQRQRAQAFLPGAVRPLWVNYLRGLGLLSGAEAARA